MVLKSIGVMSAAKIVAVMYAVMGLIAGLMVAAIFSFVPLAMDGPDAPPAWLAPMFGVGSIVMMPVVYGVIGFCVGAVGAVIYNALAGMIGGVELRLEQTPA